MEDAKEEIRSRLPVEDVVGQYIELKKAGRNLKGRSPWGVDKTPSFMVSPDKGIWHDFSSNKGGDIFAFIMEVEGISFREAIEKLAQQAGVELTKYSGGDKQVLARKVRARAALELACKFYQFCLTKNKKVIDYVFYKRNMNRQTVKEFRIGYAPNTKDALKTYLLTKGFSELEMRDAGLLNQYGGDLFRGRMMVPFMDNASNIIGFTGRVVDGGEPKYLNTPDTFLFNKSRFCFGLTQAKDAIRHSNYIVIVEGNMDVISSHQAGVKEAVATSGTAMTEGHLKILARLSNDIRLAYDGDEAGVKATERAIQLAEDIGISLSVISGYHGAKDPDELIQKDPKLWQECVAERLPAVDWILKQYESTCDLLTGPGKREYSDKAMQVISYIDDPVEKKHYEQKVAKILDVTVEDLQAKKIPNEIKRLKPVKTGEHVIATKDNLEQTIESETVKRLKVIENSLLAILVYGGEAGSVITLEVPEDETKLEELSLIYEQKYSKMDSAEALKEARNLMEQYLNLRNQQKIEQLTDRLNLAQDDEEKTAEILREIQKLRHQ